jgi:hypothetical protein
VLLLPLQLLLCEDLHVHRLLPMAQEFRCQALAHWASGRQVWLQMA